MLDTVLEGGTIYDGTGRAPYVGDIGVAGDTIQAIGNLADATATERLNVSGLAVAPGFIDLHTHSDFTLLVNGQAESQVHQGVTTEVVGQCGFSCAPVVSDSDIETGAIGYLEGCVELGWRSFGDYLNRLESTSLGVNVAACVGHGTVQQAVLGDALRAPNNEELTQMSRLVDDAFEQGAIGLSTGLEYWPGILSNIEHLVPICEVAARYDGLYATHVRNRDVYYDLAFSEAIATARASGARLQISHIQPKFGAPKYAMEHTLELIESARLHGVDIGFDVIPHDWAHARVSSILPRWAQEGGVSAILDRLANAVQREGMKRNPTPHWRLVTAGHWQDIRILHSEVNRDLVGATLAEIGRSRGIDPYDAVLDLLREEGEGLHHLLWTSHSFSDTDIRLCLQQPECAVISDTLALSPYGALENLIGSLSGYGWAARFLGAYVRDQGVISLSEAIRKLTSVPASRLKISDRGILKKGTCADIVVFDAEQIASKFTVKEPRNYATGIAHVLVNGQPVIKQGARTNENPGRVLRGGT
ncbi:MAG: N-acyl-D-amino-acid deacylase [Gammaproteobacteria bacterium]|jgi:N-acyl-D-amino-acid deacylase